MTKKEQAENSILRHQIEDTLLAIESGIIKAQEHGIKCGMPEEVYFEITQETIGRRINFTIPLMRKGGSNPPE